MKYLTKIDVPFGKLDRGTQLALFGAWLEGKTIEFRLNSSPNFDCAFYPVWNMSRTYRVKPEQEVPDSIDWSQVSCSFNYMTRDADGTACLWIHFPVQERRTFPDEGRWVHLNHKQFKVTQPSYKRGNMPWDKSLVERPQNS